MENSALDRPLDDLVKQNRHKQHTNSPSRKRKHFQLNSIRATPYNVQRHHSGSHIPSAARTDHQGAWKHDLFNSISTNRSTGKNGEEIIQFPPKKLSDKEKADLLQKNPLFHRLDENSGTGPSPQAIKQSVPTPTAPAAVARSMSAPNVRPRQPTIQPRPANKPQQSISIAGIATAPIIMSNLASTVSAEDIKTSLGTIGGGVKEVHIISSNAESIQVRVHFEKPAEGAQECISRFNGIIADGRKITVAYELPEQKKADGTISFLNRRIESTSMAGIPTVPSANIPKGPRRKQNRGGDGGGAMQVDSGPILYSDKLMQSKQRR